VVAVASRLTTPTQLVLTPTPVLPGQSAGAAAGGNGAAAAEPVAVQTPVRVDGWSATQRRLHLDAYPNQRVLALRENANPGWVATAGGRTLTPFVVDGWQQGWLVPAGLAGGGARCPGRRVRAGPRCRCRAARRGRGGQGPAAATAYPGTGAGTVRRRRGRRWRCSSVGRPAAGRRPGGGGDRAAPGLGGGGRSGLEPHLHPPDQRRLYRLYRMFARWLPVACFVLASWYAVTLGEHRRGPQLAAVATATVLWSPSSSGAGAATGCPNVTLEGA
jgi:arabinofuranan 3-O-arabinosyltransferase